MNLTAHWKALQVGILAYRTFLKMPENTSGYSAFMWRGVPHTTLLLGKGREAWRISNLASQAFVWKGEPGDGQ